jgi:hypothetical protein
MMTDAANEKIARRDMITYPSTVAEKAHSSSPPTRRFWNRLRPRAATCRSSVAPCVTCFVDLDQHKAPWNRRHQIGGGFLSAILAHMDVEQYRCFPNDETPDGPKSELKQ